MVSASEWTDWGNDSVLVPHNVGIHPHCLPSQHSKIVHEGHVGTNGFASDLVQLTLRVHWISLHTYTLLYIRIYQT